MQTEYFGGHSSTQYAENANLAPKNHFWDTLYVLKNIFFIVFFPYSCFGICVHGCDQRRTQTEHFGGYSSAQYAENADLAPETRFWDTL